MVDDHLVFLFLAQTEHTLIRIIELHNQLTTCAATKRGNPAFKAFQLIFFARSKLLQYIFIPFYLSIFFS